MGGGGGARPPSPPSPHRSTPVPRAFNSQPTSDGQLSLRNKFDSVVELHEYVIVNKKDDTFSQRRSHQYAVYNCGIPWIATFIMRQSCLSLQEKGKYSNSTDCWFDIEYLAIEIENVQETKTFISNVSIIIINISCK